LDDPDGKKRIEANYIDPMIMTQPEFAAAVKADAVKWEQIVHALGVKMD
jgi:tripartite-type tricarboxylate transporter receptor subunit TctC